MKSSPFNKAALEFLVSRLDPISKWLYSGCTMKQSIIEIKVRLYVQHPDNESVEGLIGDHDYDFTPQEKDVRICDMEIVEQIVVGECTVDGDLLSKVKIHRVNIGGVPLQSKYESLEEFKGFCDVYELHSQLGYSSPEEAWVANPPVLP